MPNSDIKKLAFEHNWTKHDDQNTRFYFKINDFEKGSGLV
jgi:hypothetical protein